MKDGSLYLTNLPQHFLLLVAGRPAVPDVQCAAQERAQVGTHKLGKERNRLAPENIDVNTAGPRLVELSKIRSYSASDPSLWTHVALLGSRRKCRGDFCDVFVVCQIHWLEVPGLSPGTATRSNSCISCTRNAAPR